MAKKSPKRSSGHGGRRAGSGRKPVAGEARGVFLQVRTSEAEKAAWKRKAEAAGESLSDVARRLLGEWAAGR